MFNNRISFLLIFITIYISCAPVIRVNSFDGKRRAPNQNKIGVFSNPQAVPYLYKEIGLITVDDEGWGRSESELLNNAIFKAQQIGAHGIIILSQDKQLDGYVPIGNVPVAVNRRIVRVTAIIKTGEKNDKVKEENTKSGSNNKFVADEIIKLKKLMDEEIITEDEFKKQKDKLLNE
jgi:hypothetical protein